MRKTIWCLTTLLFTACSADDADPVAEGPSTDPSTGDDPTGGIDTVADTTESTTDATTTTTASDGTTEATGPEPTTTGEDTGEMPLTPAELVGTFASPACEAYPDGNGGTNHLTRRFTLTEDTWHLELGLFMDDACTTPLFSVVIDGPYTLGGSSTVDGATEGDFGFTSNVWTAQQPFMAELFTDSGCGDAPWEVGVAQDVTVTGCIGVAHPIADCPEEYDIVALEGDALFFGERVTDMCTPRGRPAALNTYAVDRE